MLGLLKLDAVEFGYCCDLKMILILLGKQSASSKYCCPFCTGSSPWLDTYTATTIGSLCSDYTAYIEGGSKKSKAQQFHNVINPPLITGSDGQKILGDLFFLPEQHILTGIVGKLVKELEKKVFESYEEGKAFMDEWMASPNVNVS